MIPLEVAKSLTHRRELYHIANRNHDGTPQRWRVSGKPKIWKRSPERVRVPIKSGLYKSDYLDESTLHLLCLTEAEAEIVTYPGDQIGHYSVLVGRIVHRIPIYGCLLPKYDRHLDRLSQAEIVHTDNGDHVYNFPSVAVH